MKVMIILGVVLLLGLALAAISWGAELVQTDWSGGGGVPGPVTDWSNRFATASAVDWASPAGSLTLLSALPVPHPVTSTFGEPACVDAADLDGDNDVDVVSVAFQGDEVAWWANDGSGGGWGKTIIAASYPSANSVHACDIDRDGDIDVAATAEGGSTVAWWANDGTGTGWTYHPVDTAAAGPFSICSADFDGDQDIDLCSALFSAGDVVWWENMDGLGVSWARHTVDASFAGAWWAVAADLDGDSDVDIAGAGYSAVQIAWWENTGNGASWTKHVIRVNFPAALNARVADIDGDADLDVMGAANSGRIFWWENEGNAATWSEHQVEVGLAGPFGARLSDLDVDGDIDILTNERTGNRVIWYENVGGSGMSWLKHLVDGTSQGPNDVMAADVDGDGVPEIISTFSWDNSILWYEPSNEYQTGGSLESSTLDGGGAVDDWGTIAWTSTGGPGTSVRVQVRASSDPANLGSWAEVAASGDDLSSYIAGGTRYLQYRVLLATADSTATPSMDEIQVSWLSPADVEEPASGQIVTPWCRPTPNPSPAGRTTLEFGLPRSGALELALYDAAGRRVRTIADGFHTPGVHRRVIPGLPGGVYLYRLRAEGGQSTGKMVVK